MTHFGDALSASDWVHSSPDELATPHEGHVRGACLWPFAEWPQGVDTAPGLWEEKCLGEITAELPQPHIYRTYLNHHSKRRYYIVMLLVIIKYWASFGISEQCCNGKWHPVNLEPHWGLTKNSVLATLLVTVCRRILPVRRIDPAELTNIPVTWSRWVVISWWMLWMMEGSW